MDEIRLPIVDPLINTYPQHSQLWAILHTVPQLKSWTYNVYLSIAVVKETVDRLDFCIGYDTDNVFKNCPLIILHGIDERLFPEYSPVELCKRALSSGYYVVCMVDEYEIPAYENYQKAHIYHNIMLTGFCEKKQFFYAADHFKNGKFQFDEVAYSDFESGYICGKTCDKPYVDFLQFIKPNKNIDWFFSVYNLVKEIDCYLTGTCPVQGRFGKFDGHINQKNYAFGVDVFEHLKKYLTAIENSIDLRIFHALRCHYEYYSALLNFLTAEYYLSRDKQLILDQYAKHLLEISQKILNVSMKYNITNNVNTLMKIPLYLDCLCNEEKMFLTTLKYCFVPRPLQYSYACVNFLGVDSHTRGNWQGQYGKKGYSIVGVTENLQNQQIDYILPIDCPGFSLWEKDSKRDEALEDPVLPTRSIGQIYSFSEFNVYVSLGPDSQQISLYCVDYDHGGRNQAVVIYDPSGQMLHHQIIDQFEAGVYLKYSGYGSFRIHIFSLSPSPNVVLSAIFFD